MNFQLRAGFFLGLSLLLSACSHSASRKLSSLDHPKLDPDFASKAVSLSLHCVETESPHWEEGVGYEKGKVKQRHPAFFGCFDWHSAVHGHWAMLRVIDASPDLPERAEIVKLLNKHLTEKNIRGELAFLRKNPSFEEPYGWGWGLRLAEELHRSPLGEAKKWKRAFAPFERLLVQRIRKYLSERSGPNRVGTHDNSAFAMKHAWDYALAVGNEDFKNTIAGWARDFYGSDRACDLSKEPGDTDFLSPCFEEADLMRRVLSAEEFRSWYSGFLPNVSPEQLKPVPPKNLFDPFQVHLVGLMFSKSSAMTGVAKMLDPSEPQRETLLRAVADQIEMGGKLMFESDYGGTHWLASFAIFYYSGAGE